jgi:hypothetical protein
VEEGDSLHTVRDSRVKRVGQGDDLKSSHSVLVPSKVWFMLLSGETLSCRFWRVNLGGGSLV